jgi:hypothetical protein
MRLSTIHESHEQAAYHPVAVSKRFHGISIEQNIKRTKGTYHDVSGYASRMVKAGEGIPPMYGI